MQRTRGVSRDSNNFQRTISIQYIAFKLGVSYGTISSTIHDQLKLKELCARWIPHEVSQQCKQQRVEICQENLVKLEPGQWRMHTITTGDET